MKKILIVITTDFVPFGGLTTVMMNYYRQLNMNVFQVDFASTNSDIEKSLLDELENHNSKYYCLGNRKQQTIYYMYQLSRLLKMNKYDVIHVNSNSATAAIELIVAKWSRVSKRIVHNHTSKCNHQIIHKMMYPLFKHLYSDAVACSRKAGDWIFPDGNYTVLNNGIDTKRFKYNETFRNTVRMQYDLTNECLLLGHVGKIYEPKNHSFLIKIFAEYHKTNSNSKLMLVGDGELRSQIEKQVADLNLNDSVIFAGMQSFVEHYLSAFDIFVFPSIWEGMPLSVIEAQASGVPCIIADTIDSDINVTKKVVTLPINNLVSWVNEINKTSLVNRKISSEENILIIQNHGYDSSFNVKELEKIYIK